MEIDKITDLAIRAVRESREKGFRDNEWPISRTATKAAVEMGECINAYRDQRNAGTDAYRRKMEQIEAMKESAGAREARMSANYNTHCKNCVQDEFADVAIFILKCIGGHGLVLKQEYRVAPLAFYAQTVKRQNDFVTSSRTVFAMINEIDFGEGDTFMQANAAKYALRCLDYLEAFFSIYFPGEYLWWWVQQKMRYNNNRPMLHGRKNDPTN